MAFQSDYCTTGKHKHIFKLKHVYIRPAMTFLVTGIFKEIGVDRRLMTHSSCSVSCLLWLVWFVVKSIQKSCIGVASVGLPFPRTQVLYSWSVAWSLGSKSQFGLQRKTTAIAISTKKITLQSKKIWLWSIESNKALGWETVVCFLFPTLSFF